MTPMVILVGVILGLHMASYVEIRSTIQPLNDMVATESLTSMLAKVRYWANQASGGHEGRCPFIPTVWGSTVVHGVVGRVQVSSPDPLPAPQMTNLKWKTEMLYARGQLTDTINTTQIAWTSLLQGNSTTGLTGSGEQWTLARAEHPAKAPSLVTPAVKAPPLVPHPHLHL